MLKSRLTKLKEFRPTLDKARHILKSLSYRIYSTCITITIAALVTGDVDKALAVGVVDFSVKLFTYYIHERIWFYIPFGLQRPRKIHVDIDWEPTDASFKQIAFIQSETGGVRKRVKIVADKHNQSHIAYLSSYNSKTKERYNDIITGTKQEIEEQLKIKL
jgi:uncharacterized membrane protein